MEVESTKVSSAAGLDAEEVVGAQEETPTPVQEATEVPAEETPKTPVERSGEGSRKSSKAESVDDKEGRKSKADVSSDEKADSEQAPGGQVDERAPDAGEQIPGGEEVGAEKVEEPTPAAVASPEEKPEEPEMEPEKQGDAAQPEEEKVEDDKDAKEQGKEFMFTLIWSFIAALS